LIVRSVASLEFDPAKLQTGGGGGIGSRGAITDGPTTEGSVSERVMGSMPTIPQLHANDAPK
jgi:hypothetical protein